MKLAKVVKTLIRSVEQMVLIINQPRRKSDIVFVSFELISK